MIIANPALDGGRVLLLEDEIFISMSIRKFLAAAGAKDVLEAKTVNQALQLIESNKLDAAVLDVRLQAGTSFEVAAALTTEGVPIVFHSGHAAGAFADKFPNAVFCAKLDGPAELIKSLVKARKNIEAA